MGCAKSHAVIAAEYRAVGRNQLPHPQFTVSRRKPSRYRGPDLGNCIQPQQVLPAWTEARGKQPEAATTESWGPESWDQTSESWGQTSRGEGA